MLSFLTIIDLLVCFESLIGSSDLCSHLGYDSVSEVSPSVEFNLILSYRLGEPVFELVPLFFFEQDLVGGPASIFCCLL
jgi:hypothetical protein